MITRFLKSKKATVNQGLVTGSMLLLSSMALAADELIFDFGSGKAQPGAIRITPTTTYDAKLGHGFLGAPDAASTAARVFAVDVEEGNYDVAIRFGHPREATSTTIKAEARRLVVEKIETKPGEFKTQTFTVNVRKPAIKGGGATKLNGREQGPPMTPSWDEHLTLEFNGSHPGVAALQVKPTKDAVTVFIAGDSTVTDQRNEPWSGWGQILPRFFKQGVAVSNQAESGLALSSFESQKRLAKVLSMMKAGDYLFIQFGHNDQKDKSPDAGPFTSYKTKLRSFVKAARDKGGIPVLVTSMERRRWKDNQPETTLADYAEAVRQVAAEEKVPLIDLNAMSLKLYAALGPDESTKAFVHYPAGSFPGLDKPLKDDTHHNGYGSYELARCVVEGIKKQIPALAARLTQDSGSFDPSHPDAPKSVEIPASPMEAAVEKPAGS